ncbi:hypothetical protein DZC30_20400 [Comamonas testosteroni]|uniref:Uncharacterized protein n=1 Tax=Comamonas testosteroni TaxID=285 RepID=A0A373F8F1_COMTE|nr:hypothetical protein DZC30_20400 [Comamonas testosteroni]
MERRSSNSRKALKRKKLFLGVPPTAFHLLLFCIITILFFKKYIYLPAVVILWFPMWQATKRDTEFLDLFQTFSKEKDIYDSLPRKSIWQRIPKGWGKDIPW